jgi:hypothetical protein
VVFLFPQRKPPRNTIAACAVASVLNDLSRSDCHKILLKCAGKIYAGGWDYAQSGSESLQGIERNGLGD